MSGKLAYVLAELDALEQRAQGQSPLHGIDARAKLLVTLAFLVTMLSVPLTHLSELLLYFLFPIIAAAAGGLRYASLFRRSLFVVPLVALIGVFNLFYDREPVLSVGSLVVTGGWITLLSIVVRGLLSVQMLLVLLSTTGFYRLCRGMQRLGVPAVFTTQLLFVYRYIYVLIREALQMTRARDARSFGRRAYPLRTWGTLIGQLLLRTCCRAELIGRAMLARGFTGRIPDTSGVRGAWRSRDTAFLAVSCAVLLLLRLTRPVETLAALVSPRI